MDKNNRLEWLKKHRTWNCLKCEPRQIGYSLVKTVSWCPNCRRVWLYRYINIEQVVKKALRYWWYEDNPRERFCLDENRIHRQSERDDVISEGRIAEDIKVKGRY